ncbi:hypothetical protein LTR86_001464 [Recurvomyces mirabilis]|nr:hypothetical protein LTR86_001464 [Recurvomyces mirabilis]
MSHKMWKGRKAMAGVGKARKRVRVEGSRDRHNTVRTEGATLLMEQAQPAGPAMQPLLSQYLMLNQDVETSALEADAADANGPM